MTVYESVIEICLDPVFSEASERSDAVEQAMGPLCDRYSLRMLDTKIDETSQQKALIGLFCKRRAGHRYALAQENGYIGSYHNCVFELLYGVFGVDIIGYLFDRPWVPRATINPFRPGLFLRRLSVLEQAVTGIPDRTRTPLPLLRGNEYFCPGMGPRLMRFKDKKHRTLLLYSLGELRSFGELGRSLRLANRKPSVHINIWSPYV